MIIDLILIVIIIVLAFWIAKYKSELNKFRGNVPASSQPVVTPERETIVEPIRNEGEILRDTLTNLPGREAFNDRVNQTILQSKRYEKSFGLLLLDINDFNKINESEGHDTGDKLLIEISKRLQTNIRQIDTMSRYAGDIFIFLLSELSMPETAVYVTQRLLHSISQPFIIDDKSLLVTACIGAAIYPMDGADAKTLFENLNQALQQALLEGNGHYKFFQEDLHVLGERELNMNRLLSSSDFMQHLVMYYQPQIDITTGETIGFQAIPYLQLSKEESVSFMDFARTAENCGRIIEIGEWVVNHAIGDFHKWKLAAINNVQLSITVTYKQIESAEFIKTVTKLCQSLKVNPKEISFEIQGKNIPNDTSTLEKSFDMLNTIGMNTGINVFALGHLALQKITKLPVSYLKISGNLIKDKKSQEENAVILRMLITLAKDMDIKVIAESINEESQKAFLQNMGYNIMQGDLFAKPGPVIL